MSMATTQNAAIIGLGDETLDKLRQLRRMNVDSAKGFEECAELVKDHNVEKVFGEIARERREQAQVLATQIEWNDDSEAEEGSYLAAMHRAWIKVRETCSSDDVKAIAVEAKRGEEQLCKAYAEAEKACASSPIGETIAAQHANVKTACDHLQKLCNAESC